MLEVEDSTLISFVTFSSSSCVLCSINTDLQLTCLYCLVLTSRTNGRGNITNIKVCNMFFINNILRIIIIIPVIAP
jgi:hypothetical protein